MIQRRFYTILSIPVFLYLYSYTAVIVFLILIMAYLKWKKGIRMVMSFWAKTVFPLMGKKLHIEGKQHLKKGEKYILPLRAAILYRTVTR